jgi:hypothetical protein
MILLFNYYNQIKNQKYNQQFEIQTNENINVKILIELNDNLSFI